MICDSNYTQTQSRDIFIIILIDVVSSHINALKLTSSQMNAMFYSCELLYEIDIIKESLKTDRNL